MVCCAGSDAIAGVHTCVEVEGHNVCTVRTPHDTVSMPFNWVAGPATTQAEFFKGGAIAAAAGGWQEHCPLAVSSMVQLQTTKPAIDTSRQLLTQPIDCVFVSAH